jgi:transcriptional regulator with XRE-family HTH domain
MEMHDGNLFFKHKYPTISIEHAVERFDTFEEFEKFFTDDLMDENLLLADYLYHLLDRYGVSANKAALQIGKTHSYVRKIVNGDELNPSRDVLLALCVYLGTTVEEAQILLRYAGKSPLYARRKRDVIVWFALRKHQSLGDLNIYLEKNGYKSLSKLIEKKEK